MAGNKKQKDRTDFVCHKNQELTLEITDMGTNGEGIGKIEGYTLFVKDALMGDKVQVKVMKTKKRFGYAKLLEILQPSPYRVEPVCPVARQCGGCQLQHCSYEKQLEWKRNKVAECIQRIGGISVQLIMDEIIGMEHPYHYRNKAQFPVSYNRYGELITGFYAGRTHDIISCTDCCIQHPCNQPILETILAFMEEFGIPAYREKQHTGLVRHIMTRVGYWTGEVMICLVLNGDELPHQQELVDRLLTCDLSGEGENRWSIKSIILNVNREKTNVILGSQIKTLYGTPYIEDLIGDIRYRISPLSFYQVNPVQTEKLYRTVMEYAELKGDETVWDLYCGIGTISLFLAQTAKMVYGVEIVPEAIQDARENAKINGITNTEFFVGAAEEMVPEQYQQSIGALRADLVVLDPPRKGCDEKLLATVVQMRPEKIVYVSCDPATLARDLKYLCGEGYEVKRVRACDMFGHSAHVESVCLLHRRDM